MCGFLAEPLKAFDPQAVEDVLAGAGLDRAATEVSGLAPYVDRVLFDYASERLSRCSEREWHAALIDAEAVKRARVIALAPAATRDAFARCAGAAALHVPLARNLTKAASDRIRAVLGAEAADVAFGEAQFLYADLAGIDDAEKVYAAFAATDDADAERRFVGFGRAIVRALLNAESPLWATVFELRAGKASYPSVRLLPAHRTLLFKLWDRKCRKWPIS